MKIIVLGGAGDMGSRTVEDLVMAEDVSLVTIADRNVEAGDDLARRLKGKGAKVEVKAVDANDHAGLVKALKGYDVAAGALGPFFMFESKLVRAAIEAGVDYGSICDEWEPAEEVIGRYDDRAREKGVTVITGLGASPGVTNVLVRHLAGRLDRLRRVKVSVLVPMNGGVGGAALRHALYIMTGEVAVWRGGQRRVLKALSDEQQVDFPRFGRTKAWNMGHSEPVTIPRYLPEVEEVGFYMGMGRGAWPIIQLARWGAFAGPRRADFFTKILDRIEKLLAGSEPGWGAMRVDVWGDKEGREAHLMNCGTGQMREITGLSLAVGALMLGRKQLFTDQGGVYAPEGCLESKIFLEGMNQRGVYAYKDLDMTRIA